MDGLLLIDKPAGMTSHDVVARLRRLARTRKIGHTGTLDPDATGLLPLTIGACTKLAQHLILDAKAYSFTARFGAGTTTDDASGEVIATGPVDHLSLEVIEAALDPFRGDIMQRPPRFSAIRVDGRRAYDMAREGLEFELDPRPVRVDALRLDSFESPDAEMFMACGSGTYVRSIVRDLGVALGTAAHTTRIHRVRVGMFHVEQATPLDALEGMDPEAIAALLLTPAQMMASLPSRALTDEEVVAVRQGKALSLDPEQPHDEDTKLALLDPTGALVAIAEVSGGGVRPRRVLA